MKQIYKKIRRFVPLYAIIIFAIAVLSLLTLIIERLYTPYADFINSTFSRVGRVVMGYLFGFVPFSIAEFLIISSPLWIALLVYFGIKMAKRSKESTFKFISFVASVLCFIFISFVWTYSSGYYTTTIDKKLGFERESIEKEELYETSLWLVENLNMLAPEISYDEANASVMPYSYDELSKNIYYAYDAFIEKYGVLHNFASRIKPIILSEPMTYTHISGIYSFMTGEANLNVNFPDFIVASSAAHEMAHQRGIAREEEANFVAFMVCINSDDTFINYSGYLDVFNSVSGALYSADKELYSDVISKLDKRVIKDIISYGEFFEKYQDSKAADITDSMNDKYLQMNGQEQGSRSYGMVTDLCVAYYKSIK